MPCKACGDSGIIKVQRGEMLCPECLRSGSSDVARLMADDRRIRAEYRASRPARRSSDSAQDREINIQGGELFD